MYQW